MNNKNYIPDCKLEWYLVGALSPEEHAEIAALEQSDEELRGRIEALRASDAEILAEYPPSRIAERLRERYQGGARVNGRQRKRDAQRWPITIYICAALLLVLPMLIIVGPALIDTIEADGDEIHIEGDAARDSLDSPALQGLEGGGVTEEGTETLEPDATATQAGDTAQALASD